MRSKPAIHGARTLVAACLVGLYSMPLFAAQAGDQANTNAGTTDRIEEIVVTAERRTTRLMETPIPASVLSQEELRIRGITDLDGLQFGTPSLTVNSYGGGNLVNIRGVGRTEVVTQAAAGVPIYRDGQFIGMDWQLLMPISVMLSPISTSKMCKCCVDHRVRSQARTQLAEPFLLQHATRV